MGEELFNPTIWHWVALAIILLGLELVAPATFFLWLSIAAAASAIVKLVFPDLGLANQLVLFALFSFVSLIAWHRYGITGREAETDNPQLNQRNERYMGRVVKVSQAIEDGVGKVTVEDSQWKVHGPDAEVGTKVRVVAVEGSIFKVELA